MKRSIMPQLQIFSQVRSKEGIILFESAEEGHSWTWNAYNLVTGFMLDVSMSSVAADQSNAYRADRLITRTNGAIRTGTVNRDETYASHGFQNRNASAEIIASYGLIVGTDDTPFEIDDMALYGLIEYGNTSGRLLHAAMPNPITTWDEATNRFYADYTRFFNNNSGDTITIKEVALASYSTVGIVDPNLVLTRDVLETPIEVPDGGRVTLTYRIWSFPFDEVIAKMHSTCSVLLGTAGNGGYCMGGRFGVLPTTSAILNGGYPIPNHKYLMILAPVACETTAVYLNPATSLTRTVENLNYGLAFSDYLVSLPTSGIGAALAAYRTATGDPDWYIPSACEILDLFTRNANLPTGQEFSVVSDYWASTPNTTSGYILDVSASDMTTLGQNQTRRVRFMKRINRNDWSPD